MAKILIIEDDTDLADTYRDFLEARGHSVIQATRITEATEQLFRSNPEIITLDLHLPGGTSTVIADFIGCVKAVGHAKVIVISGHTEMIMGEEWLQNADLVLTKPINYQHLTVMIDRLLLTPSR